MTDLPITFNLQYDDISDNFAFTYKQGEDIVFQAKMSSECFEKLTSDMVRTVKDYNLNNAQNNKKRLESGEGESKICPIMEDRASESFGVEGASQQPTDTQQEESRGVVEELPRV